MPITHRLPHRHPTSILRRFAAMVSLSVTVGLGIGIAGAIAGCHNSGPLEDDLPPAEPTLIVVHAPVAATYVVTGVTPAPNEARIRAISAAVQAYSGARSVRIEVESTPLGSSSILRIGLEGHDLREDGLAKALIDTQPELATGLIERYSGDRMSPGSTPATAPRDDQTATPGRERNTDDELTLRSLNDGSVARGGRLDVEIHHERSAESAAARLGQLPGGIPTGLRDTEPTHPSLRRAM